MSFVKLQASQSLSPAAARSNRNGAKWALSSRCSANERSATGRSQTLSEAAESASRTAPCGDVLLYIPRARLRQLAYTSRMIQLAHGKNVLGSTLVTCCRDPLTGFYRDGMCRTGSDDHGVHTVCIRASAAFLAFSKSRGNDLQTPLPGFPGLKTGDQWCLCAERWQEAFEAGMAPPVVLEATHAATLTYCRLEDLKLHAWKPE